MNRKWLAIGLAVPLIAVLGCWLYPSRDRQGVDAIVLGMREADAMSLVPKAKWLALGLRMISIPCSARAAPGRAATQASSQISRPMRTSPIWKEEIKSFANRNPNKIISPQRHRSTENSILNCWLSLCLCGELGFSDATAALLFPDDETSRPRHSLSRPAASIRAHTPRQ